MCIGRGKRKDDLRNESTPSVRVRGQGTGIKSPNLGQERARWSKTRLQVAKGKRKYDQMTDIVPRKRMHERTVATWAKVSRSIGGPCFVPRAGRKHPLVAGF